MTERIALMIESDGPGGAESVVLALAIEYRNRGHTVFPVVHGGGPGWLSGRLRREGFEVFQPRLRRPLDFSMIGEMADWLRHHQITVSHTHEFTTSVYGGFGSRAAGIPHVMTMHGGTSYTLAMRRRVALSLAAHMAHAVVGVSDDTARTLQRALWLAPQRTRVVTNGITVRTGSRERGRVSLSVQDHDFAMLAVGNLYPVKGHDILIRAAAILRQTIPQGWRIFIAGRGDQEHPLRSLIAREGLQEHVVLLGLRDDIHDLLAASDLFVMPSRSEGLPMAILEAMFARCPVIASAVGGIPELLVAGSYGRLFRNEDVEDLATALVEGVRERELFRARAERALQTVRESYSAQAMADAYLKLVARR